MLDIIRDGENRYRLLDHDGVEVGWIRGRAVRFLGFTSKDEVMRAAVAAWRALRRVLMPAAAGPRARPNPDLDELRLVHDGAYEWISDGRIPIARLFRMRAEDGTPGFYAIELLVPSHVEMEMAVTAAHAIADALAITRPVNALPA